MSNPRQQAYDSRRQNMSGGASGELKSLMYRDRSPIKGGGGHQSSHQQKEDSDEEEEPADDVR